MLLLSLPSCSALADSASLIWSLSYVLRALRLSIVRALKEIDVNSSCTALSSPLLQHRAKCLLFGHASDLLWRGSDHLDDFRSSAGKGASGVLHPRLFAVAGLGKVSELLRQAWHLSLESCSECESGPPVFRTPHVKGCAPRYHILNSPSASFPNVLAQRLFRVCMMFC